MGENIDWNAGFFFRVNEAEQAECPQLNQYLRDVTKPGYRRSREVTISIFTEVVQA